MSPRRQQGESPRRQQGESPSPSRDWISLGEVGRLGVEGAAGENGDSTMTKKDKEELERGIREALFRKRETPDGSVSRSVSQPYKGRPLQGVWATAGQTGASVVRTGEPLSGENLAPVKFSISSPASSSGQVTPQRSGSRTPNSRHEPTPPPKLQGSNWSTLSPSAQRRRGNRGTYRHSKSGPEYGHEGVDQKSSPRRYHSEQYSGETDQSNHQNESRDQTHQSDVNNWNIHMPRSRRGNDRRGRGEWLNHGKGEGRGRGRGRGEMRRGRGRGRGEGRGRDQYQRSQSDVTGRTHTRGEPVSRHRNPPHSEPSVK